MVLPAPNLDDRHFQDLVDDAKRLVQQRCPEWTDHNVSDPGVTLIEAFAQMVDQLIYRLNRVPDRNYIKFLELIGVELRPPAAARGRVTFWLSAPQPQTVVVRAETEVATPRTDVQAPIVFTTTGRLDIVDCSLSFAACAAAGLSYTLNPGEGAFYGPKLEFVLRDAIGRDWQCGTMQVDYVLPERLDAEYVTAESTRARPVMLHRAILGSFERFLGILIEQYAGRFPLWLAPVQAVVATIVSDADDYAHEVAAALKAAGLAVETDVSNQKINAKIRDHSLHHVPNILVVGRKEAEDRTVALRRLGGAAQEILPLSDAIAALKREAIPPDLA